MTDLSQLGEELRRIEDDARIQRECDRMIADLYAEEQGHEVRAADRIGDFAVGVVIALIFLAFVYPDLIAFIRGLPPVLVTP